MKKKRLWKKLAGWLLVFLLVLQIPIDAYAQEWTIGNDITIEDAEGSGDSVDIETEEDTVSGEDLPDIEDETDSNTNLDTEGSSTSEFTDEDESTDEDEFTDGSTALFSDGTVQSEDKIDEKKEIQVTVSVSKDGKFLDDKDGNPMAGRTVTLTGQSSYTMDDALKLAHDLYYPGGSDAGYDYHADDAGIFDGVIYRLWGYNKNDVPYIRSALNHDIREYGSALSRNVQDGDELHFYIQQTKGTDRLAFFTENEITVSQSESVELQLRQSNNSGTGFSSCEGASIYIDGVKQEDILTDADGKVTLPALEARETPYFITAEKLIDNDGAKVTAISAVYANVTVVPNDGDSGDYISSVGLSIHQNEIEINKETINIFDGSQFFIFPSGSSHGDFYATIKGSDNLPEDCSLYAVYTNPSDGTVKRVKLSQNSPTLLKNTSVEYSPKAILSISFEVRKNGNVLQTVKIPIHYKACLSFLTVSDSWGHAISTGLKNTAEDQNLEVTVPINTEYIDISGSDRDCWGSIAENPELITLEGAELTKKPLGGALRFTPDWEKYSEYKAVITLPKDESKFISEDTVYTLTIKPGDIDYTPVLTDNSADYCGIMQGETAEPFTVSAAVLREDEGSLSYQWYECDTPANANSIEKYTLIPGASEPSYTISTEQAHAVHYYKCVVTYTIDGKTYSAVSNFFRATVFPYSIDDPIITEQPQNLQCVRGTKASDLTVTVQNDSEFSIETEYQWYQNTENNVDGGQKISGATESSYTPDIKEIGTTYYFCKIRAVLSGNADGKKFKIYSDEIVTDVVSVIVTDAPLPWEGKGTEGSPYLIKTTSDIEDLRDKVNKEGFSFEDTYFQLAEDITLPDEWKPIGATKNGRVDLQGGENLNAFSGILDGNNHTVTIPEGGLPLFGYVRNTRIRNLNIYGTKIAGYGLVNNFEGVGLSGMAVEIDNVTLKSGSSTLKAGLLGANKTMSAYAGCSSAFEATVRNCTIEKDVVIGYSKKETEIGAIAGRMQGTVENCVSYATVYGTRYVGGIIGTRDNAMGNCSVIGCKFYGTVEASGELAGGIAGGGQQPHLIF